MIERREFGAWLRREREHRGISLDAVAEQTKINVALLAGLERGDLTRWPTGIFRRAFVRSYAAAVGLDVDHVSSLFSQRFPEDDEGVVSVPAFQRAGAHADPLRLTLARGPIPTARVWLVRVLAAALDALVVAVAGALVAATGLAGFGVAALCVAGIHFTAGTLLAESTPGWWFSRRWLRVKPAAAAVPVSSVALADEDHESRRHPADPPVRPGRRDRRPARHERQRVRLMKRAQ